MLNYIDKLRIAATFLVFCLHSLLFTGKNFPMMDTLKDSGGVLYIFYSCLGWSMDIFCIEWFFSWSELAVREI